MPIHIDIRINRELINTLHIARVKGGTKPDDINDYLILEGDEPLRYEDWLVDGVPFTHRYGDGAEICVMKGIQAVHGHEGYTTAEVFDAGADQERERIIKLLEDEVRHDFPPIIEMSLDNLKALIKGEQK